MNWVHDTLTQCAARMPAGATLAVEPGPGVVPEHLLILCHPLGFEGGAVARKALTQAHYGLPLPMPVQVAVRGQGPNALLLAVVRIASPDFTPQALGRAAEFLARWCEGVFHGS